MPKPEIPLEAPGKFGQQDQWEEFTREEILANMAPIARALRDATNARVAAPKDGNGST